MTPLLALFVTEARDLLQEAGEDLLALERAGQDEDAVNRLFRSLHTLKGSSGLFEAAPLTRVLHAAEDLFQAVREERLPLTPQMVDHVLKALDQTGRWIDDLERHGALQAHAEQDASRMVGELRALFGQRTGEPLAPGAAPPDPAPPPLALATWFPDGDLARAAAAGDPLTLVSYRPDERCFFKGDDPLHLAMQIPGLQALRTVARAPWAPLPDLDPFACAIDLHALSTAGPEAIETLFRYVRDQVTIVALPAASLRLAAAPADALAWDDPNAALAMRLLHEQVDLLAVPAPEDELDGRLRSAATVAANALRFAGKAAAADALASAGAEAVALRRATPLTDAIAALLARPPRPVSAAAPASAGDPPAGAAAAAPDRVATRSLRVDQDKIDALMNLVGELVVAKNSLPFLARRAEHQYGLRELGREIKDQFSVIDRIAQELQGAIMAVRMMPVGQVFQRLPRLVRDLSRRLDKQVDLAIEGEDTEADKNVIEALFDPLMHMVRNSLDHGIEPPAERLAAGKPAGATIALRARHDGDQVVIEVADDGRGIDPEIVKRKAYERGLLEEARLAAISDAEATALIFAAGFSTAETVSDVSGRGVGMDVVRSAVEKAGGRIALDSRKGVGTTVRLHLPLSMAVSRVMTVALGDRLFGIPMDLIHETVKVPRADIVTIKDREAFLLRDRVVPLVHLARLLDVPDEAAGAEDVAVLVVRIGGQTLGLAISAFGEGMEVILKPLDGLLARIVGYAGTAMLGDGRVLLVLDLKELMQ